MRNIKNNIFIISLVLNLSILYVGFKAIEYRSHINEFLEKYTYVIDEFSGRNSYLLENQKFKADSTVPGRVVFMGTQLTCDWDVKKYLTPVEPINRGIVGQRYSGYLLRFRSDVINLHPQAVLIEFSSYNFRPESQIAEFIEYTQNLSELAIYNDIIPILTTVLPVGKDIDIKLEVPYDINDSITVYNDWLRNYCTKKNITYIDFCSLLSDTSGFFDSNYRINQIQPNEQGYSILSRNVSDILQKVGIPFDK